MAAPATPTPAPSSTGGKPGAGSGRLGPFPLWVWVVGVGGVALFFMRSRAKSGGDTAGTGAPASGFAIDPNTGFPIDPTTGLPAVTSQPTSQTDIATWARNAFAALTGAGVAPGLANQALYDYQNGNPLSDAEAAAINKALGLIGYAPGNLPFLGNVPSLGNGNGATSAPKNLPFITPDEWKKLGKAAQSQWLPFTTKGGAHGFVPKPSGGSASSPVIVQIGSDLYTFFGGDLFKRIGPAKPTTAAPLFTSNQNVYGIPENQNPLKVA